MLLKARSHSASGLNMISLYNFFKVKTNTSHIRLLYGGRFFMPTVHQ